MSRCPLCNRIRNMTNRLVCGLCSVNAADMRQRRIDSEYRGVRPVTQPVRGCQMPCCARPPVRVAWFEPAT